jgi:CheY-like chemotaxis protein
MSKILLVEDNAESREGLARRLQRRGYEVVPACDGQQGVDLARSSAPDLILMDINLPVLDGWEATRQIKAGERTRAIPIIALTAHALTSDRQKTLEAGCDDYHTKPVELARLLNQIEALLGGRRPEPAAALPATS